MSEKMNTLEIRDLNASVNGQMILNGVSLTIRSGEIHAIMGPNGSGKSTLCYVLMGHPKYKVEGGKILLNGEDITEIEPNKRANKGLFLGFQSPLEIAGVTFGNFMRLAKSANEKAINKNAKPIAPGPFIKVMQENLELLAMEKKFAGRSVNEGFSGGERKRSEIVQMSILEPKIAMLDEIDSGLDIDALKVVAQGVNQYQKKSNAGILIITHYQRLLNYIHSHHVHVMSRGSIVKSGGPDLAIELEKEGYQKFIHEKQFEKIYAHA